MNVIGIGNETYLFVNGIKAQNSITLYDGILREMFNRCRYRSKHMSNSLNCWKSFQE